MNALSDRVLRWSPRQWIGIVGLLVCLQLGSGLLFLSAVPRVMDDEAFEGSLGHSLAFEGRIRTQVMTGCGAMEDYLIQNRLLLPVATSAAFRIAGYSLTAGRFVSVLFAAVVVWSICMILRPFGERLAAGTALLTMVHPWFLDISRRTRPEIYYLALALLGLYFWIVWRSHMNRSLAMLAGFFWGLACVAHPAGCLLVAAIALSLVTVDRRIQNIVGMTWAFVGGMLPLIAFAWYVVAIQSQSVVDFFVQMRGCHEDLVKNSVSDMIRAETQRWKAFLALPKGVFVAIGLGVAWFAAWIRSNSADRSAAMVVCCYSFMLPFAASHNRYLAVLIPFFSYLVLRLFVRLWSGGRMDWQGGCRFGRRALAGALIASYTLSCFGAVVLLFHRLHGGDLDRALDRIALSVSPEQRVYGSPVLWMGGDRYQYRPYLGYDPELGVDQIIDRIREEEIEFAVITSRGFGSSFGFSRPPVGIAENRSDHVRVLCDRYGNKIDEFVDPSFGKFEVYQLSWGDDIGS